MSSVISAFSTASGGGLFGKGLFKRQQAAAVAKDDTNTETGTRAYSLVLPNDLIHSRRHWCVLCAVSLLAMLVRTHVLYADTHGQRVLLCEFFQHVFHYFMEFIEP